MPGSARAPTASATCRADGGARAGAARRRRSDCAPKRQPGDAGRAAAPPGRRARPARGWPRGDLGVGARPNRSRTRSSSAAMSSAGSSDGVPPPRYTRVERRRGRPGPNARVERVGAQVELDVRTAPANAVDPRAWARAPRRRRRPRSRSTGRARRRTGHGRRARPAERPRRRRRRGAVTVPATPTRAIADDRASPRAAGALLDLLDLPAARLGLARRGRCTGRPRTG